MVVIIRIVFVVIVFFFGIVVTIRGGGGGESVSYRRGIGVEGVVGEVIVVVVVGKDGGIVGVHWRRFFVEKRIGRQGPVSPELFLHPDWVGGAKFLRVAEGS